VKLLGDPCYISVGNRSSTSPTKAAFLLREIRISSGGHISMHHHRIMLMVGIIVGLMMTDSASIPLLAGGHNGGIGVRSRDHMCVSTRDNMRRIGWYLLRVKM